MHSFKQNEAFKNTFMLWVIAGEKGKVKFITLPFSPAISTVTNPLEEDTHRWILIFN